MKLVKSAATLLATVALLAKSENTVKSSRSVSTNKLQNSLCSNNSQCPKNSSCKNNKCVCEPGFSGDKCELIEPKVRCLPDRIEVLINKNWAKNKANVDSYQQIYLGSDSENTNCQSIVNPEDENTYILNVSEDSTCGTKVTRDTTTSDYVYTNEVISSSLENTQSSSNEDISDITRLPKLSLVSWQCVYKSKYDISYTDKTDNSIVPIKISDKVVLPNKSEIKIQSYSDDSFASSQLQSSTLYDGDNIYLEVSNVNKNLNFDIQKCTVRMVEEETTDPSNKGDKNSKDSTSTKTIQIKGNEDKSQIFAYKQCENSQYLTELFPNTQVLKNTKKDLKIAYKINRDDFSQGSKNADVDPQVYIRCEVTDEEIQNEECVGKSARKISKREANKSNDNKDSAKNSNKNTNSNDEDSTNFDGENRKTFIIENGPFTIKSAESKLVSSNNPNNSQTQLADSNGNNSENIIDNNDNNNDSNNEQTNTSSEADAKAEALIDDDEEHSLTPPDAKTIADLLNMLDKVKDSVDKADAVQLEAVLQHLQRASEDIKPLVELTSEYSFTEFERPGPIYQQLGENVHEVNVDGDYISVEDMSEAEAEKAKRRVRTMAVLAVSIGIIFICLIALPILFVFYRNNVANSSKVMKNGGHGANGSNGHSGDAEKGQNHGNKATNSANNNGTNGNESPSKFETGPNQIITIDTGLNVDHALHFVEYTDHIHDLVFESEDNDQYPTNMWIKQISTDTQSIDISNQDPIKMTYTNSLYTKNSHNPNNSTSSSHGAPGSGFQQSNIICSQDIHRTSSNSSSKSSINSFTINTKKTQELRANNAELPVPSYVTMQSMHNASNNNIKRKKSFRLAGVKIPSEIINTIMPHQKTSQPYKTNNNNNAGEASCRGSHNPVFE